MSLHALKVSEDPLCQANVADANVTDSFKVETASRHSVSTKRVEAWAKTAILWHWPACTTYKNA